MTTSAQLRDVPHRPATTTLLVLALLASGCTMQTKPPTNVTSSSAVLNAQVGCTSAPYGPVWWELREAGGSAWRLVGAEQSITCPRGVQGSSTVGISEPVNGLAPGAAYEFRVGMNPPSGEGPPVYSTVTRFSTGGDRRPVVVGSTLQAGGARLQLRGVNVWGLQDSITTSFGAGQYANRAKVAATIKSWGANLVRFRVLADDYNSAPSAATGNLTKAQIIQRIKDWRDAVVGRGMYFMPCSWDALDGAHSDAGWAGNGGRVHQMFADIHAALGDDPMVVYEVTNEPNSVTWSQWDANMQASIKYFRETIGYQRPARDRPDLVGELRHRRAGLRRRPLLRARGLRRRARRHGHRSSWPSPSTTTRTSTPARRGTRAPGGRRRAAGRPSTSSSRPSSATTTAPVERERTPGPPRPRASSEAGLPRSPTTPARRRSCSGRGTTPTR